MLSEEKRIKTKGAAEILVKRRIGVLKDLIENLQLGLTSEEELGICWKRSGGEWRLRWSRKSEGDA